MALMQSRVRDSESTTVQIGSIDGGATVDGPAAAPDDSINFCIVRFQTSKTSGARPGCARVTLLGFIGRYPS
jgi:hypothetical protein